MHAEDHRADSPRSPIDRRDAIKRLAAGATLPAVGAMLDRFDVRTPRRLELVHRWLGAVTRLFRPQLDWLLEQRDQRIAREMPRRPNLFEDRRTELLSECALDLGRQFARLEHATAPARG